MAWGTAAPLALTQRGAGSIVTSGRAAVLDPEKGRKDDLRQELVGLRELRKGIPDPGRGVRVHTSGFGSYKHLLPVLALPVIVANCIIVGGIILAMLTGKDNIYSAPEFSGGVDGKTWGHVGGHVLVTVLGPFILWLVGCLIMFVTKKVTGSRAQTVGTGV